MVKYKMYLTMVARALLKRKSRVAVALASLVIGTGVIFSAMSVYYDINLKMSRELRTYGANFIMVPAGGDFISDKEINITAGRLQGNSLLGYTPYLYGIASIGNRKVVVGGLWMDQIAKVSPYWEVSPQLELARGDRKAVLIGKNVAAKMDLKVGSRIELDIDETGNGRVFMVQGIVKTGSAEDNQVFIDLAAVQELFGRGTETNLAYFSLVGKSDDLLQKVNNVNQSLSGSQLKPIKQISRSEGIILEKIKSLAYLVIVIIMMSTLLCVSITMMVTVIERRKEIGLRKALGAQNRSITAEFLGEGLILGLAGGMLGILLGFGMAQAIGLTVFKSYISFRVGAAVAATLMSIAVVGAASFIPVKMAVKVEPALILKGE